MKRTYKYLRIQLKTEPPEEALDNLAAQGWKLVAIEPPTQPNTKPFYVFMQENEK